MLSGTSRDRIKPANELCVDNLEDIVSIMATAQPREDRLRFRMIFVRVGFKIYSNGVVPIQEGGYGIEQISVFRLEAATAFQNLIARPIHRDGVR